MYEAAGVLLPTPQGMNAPALLKHQQAKGTQSTYSFSTSQNI